MLAFTPLITNSLFRSRRVAAIGLALGLVLCATPALATPDHLQCFKVKDAVAKGIYEADLWSSTPVVSNVAPGCTLRTPAKLYCIGAETVNVTPTPPNAGSGQSIQQSYLCYKAKCNLVRTFFDATDAYGTREMDVQSTSLICAPLLKPEACSVGTAQCGNTCADLSSDPQNCGSCGIDCGGSPCIGGACQSVCAPDETYCGDVCVDLSSDVQNCGACGTFCFDGEACVNGQCQQSSCSGLPCEQCQLCAQEPGGACENEIAALLDHPDGSAFLECVVACLDPSCTGMCMNQYPEAAMLYEAAATCILGYCPDCQGCGDGFCNIAGGETSDNCPSDCGGGAVCGNGVCEVSEDSNICPEDCAAGSPDGCTPASGAGCVNCACESQVCGADPYCCETQWDDICVLECESTGQQCAPRPPLCVESDVPVCGGDCSWSPGTSCQAVPDGVCTLGGGTCSTDGDCGAGAQCVTCLCVPDAP